jgi:excisionase family DNA binding protein
MNGWYSPEDVARIVNHSPRTIQRWCREERIRHTKVGRLYRFTQAQVDQLEARFARGPQQHIEVDIPNPAYEEHPTAQVLPLQRPHPAA